MNNIDKPERYHKNGIDVIGFAELQFDAAELRGFYRINALKYMTRFDRKDAAVDDLLKCRYYINKLIELEESQS